MGKKIYRGEKREIFSFCFLMLRRFASLSHCLGRDDDYQARERRQCNQRPTVSMFTSRATRNDEGVKRLVVSRGDYVGVEVREEVEPGS